MGGRHQGDARKKSQGFGEVKTPEAKGLIRIASGNRIIKMAGHDVDMSLHLGSAGEELMEEIQIIEVVKDH